MKIKLFLLLTFMTFAGLPMMSQSILPSYRIWNSAPHNAFTSLIEYDGYLYCAFREALSHVDKTGNDLGIIRIIKSRNGLQWESIGLLSRKGSDLRDPNFSISKDNRLMVSFAGVEYNGGKAISRHTFVSIQKRGKFRKPRQLKTGFERDWLWRIKWAGDKTYSFNYLGGFHWMSSNDGKIFETLKTYPFPGNPSEADFCINGDSVFVALRNDRGVCQIGKGTIDGNFIWKESNLFFYGPNLLQLKDGRILLFSRALDVVSQKTELGAYQYMNDQFVKIASFPFKGDSGYFGSVERVDDVFVTYYSTLQNQQTSIYAASLPKIVIR